MKDDILGLRTTNVNSVANSILDKLKFSGKTTSVLLGHLLKSFLIIFQKQREAEEHLKGIIVERDKTIGTITEELKRQSEYILKLEMASEADKETGIVVTGTGMVIQNSSQILNFKEPIFDPTAIEQIEGPGEDEVETSSSTAKRVSLLQVNLPERLRDSKSKRVNPFVMKLFLSVSDCILDSLQRVQNVKFNIWLTMKSQIYNSSCQNSLERKIIKM